MGRTIPSFRIAAVLEEKRWKQYRKFLNNKNDRKVLDNMFSTAMLYNSACSNAVNPIRIHPIMMSIILHHYRILKERGFDKSSHDHDNDSDDINEYNNNDDSTILKQEIEKWYDFSFVLREKNRLLFEEMLRSSYKYSSSINAKGNENSTESLFMSLIFEQYKQMILNSNHNHLSIRDL
ncbi:MAG TPA: hypothetical protein VHJ38_05030 [Nitrososphaeraceae archaeon]|jgi:hypothetical protein|nr:hypothetical protein [Nitrososphaeraceae archaeon]